MRTLNQRPIQPPRLARVRVRVGVRVEVEVGVGVGVRARVRVRVGVRVGVGVRSSCRTVGRPAPGAADQRATAAPVVSSK